MLLENSIQKLLTERKIDFDLATALLDQLPESFWKTLSFDQWLKIYGRTEEGSNLEKFALDKMSDLINLAFEKMKKPNISAK